MHGSVGDGGGDSTYEKALDIELTGLKSDKEGTVIHKEMKHGGSGLESKGGGVYERVIDINMRLLVVVRMIELTPQWTIALIRQTSQGKDHSDLLQGGYSKIDQSFSEVTQPFEADDPIYSDPDIAPNKALTSPPCVSLQHKESDVPQDSEYAVIGQQ